MTVELPDDFASACQWADSYRALGLAVIPAAGREKIPVGKWREFQSGIPQTVHDRWYGNDGEHGANLDEPVEYLVLSLELLCGRSIIKRADDERGARADGGTPQRAGRWDC